MATLRAYAHGTTSYVEWTIGREDENALLEIFRSVGGNAAVVVLPTSTGRIRLATKDWAALELIS